MCAIDLRERNFLQQNKIRTNVWRACLSLDESHNNALIWSIYLEITWYSPVWFGWRPHRQSIGQCLCDMRTWNSNILQMTPARMHSTNRDSSYFHYKSTICPNVSCNWCTVPVISRCVVCVGLIPAGTGSPYPCLTGKGLNSYYYYKCEDYSYSGEDGQLRSIFATVLRPWLLPHRTIYSLDKETSRSDERQNAK